MLSYTPHLLSIGSLFWAFSVDASPILARDSPTPGLPFDPNTTKYCTWWADLTTATACPAFLDENFKQNPSITADCGGLIVGKSYCVEVLDEPAPAPGTTTQEPISATTISVAPTISTKSSTIASTTTTSAGNGVATPQPTQPGMVSNCNKFHFVAKGVTCSQVISYQKISLADFAKWNPTVGSDCTGMWADVNVCVGVIGGATTTTVVPPITTTAKPSTTVAGNGVQTPQPTQPGMVTNCAKFHYVAKGVTCSQVISYQKISLADFVKWNPTVGSDCTGMQAEVNVCVGLIGATTTTSKPTTTTSAGNGVATPQPTQPGMVTNCKKFHYVAEGVTCSQIISYQKITLADFVKWNTGVGSDCRNMWAKTNVCVGV
ncbi:carbohydrate-binding module family 50 protein [Plenodomus tracheiphilus IPT5]|uniref:Carbohydrate-binding module family 50 protein n=1 Tax=Plenodomus tracheiphilus IPT5 TaxID=1408161 RepID=A0A6A7BDR6_9PLEO|nr:carbohydrate-binding module family 50 protein [Plenodomus tracheiphilus IPT5]